MISTRNQKSIEMNPVKRKANIEVKLFDSRNNFQTLPNGQEIDMANTCE